MPSDGIDTVGRGIENRTPVWMLAALIVAAVALVSYPNLRGFWGRDDFAQLALVRMIGAPWQFFITDHYFVIGSVFRPLGFFSQWLCVKLFGIDYAPNAAFDIALHAAVALYLFRILLRPSIPPLVAAACALLFALHPVTIGPSLWWSARFDLLSTLFALIAVSAGMAYRERAATRALVCAFVASLAAMSSKENGLVAVAALTLIWGRWIFTAPAQRKKAVTAIISVWPAAVLFFLWRRSILGTFSSGVTGSVSMGEAFERGLLSWTRDAAGYLSFFPRMAAPGVMLVCVGIVIAAGALASSGFMRDERRRPVDVDVLLVGALLFITPIVTQAPIIAFASPLSADMSAIEAGMQSRLYYLQTAGLVSMLAAVIGPLYGAAIRWVRIAVTCSMALVTATFAWASHGNAQEFGQRSFDIAAPARAAMAAVEPLVLPASHCHIAFQGYAPPPEWGDFVSMDSIIKALSAGKSIRNCWIHADRPTYFHIHPRSASAADALPFRPEQKNGRETPWRYIGKVVYAYLAPPDEKAVMDSGMPFFVMKDGRFVDASADVRAGAIAVGLK